MSAILHRADLGTLWLLGNPVSHSMSPLIQNTALQHLGLPIIYQAASVESGQFECAVRGLQALGALGANVTVPHKEAAFRIADEVTPRAQAMGACNVLSFAQGRVLGDNTDGSGWWRGLTERFGPRVPSHAIVLGAGGASRAIVATLSQLGVSDLILVNRTRDRAERLATEVAPNRCRVEPLENFLDLLEPDSLVVQTTSAGLDPSDSPLPLPSSWPARTVLSELIYGSTTPLARAVTELGGEVQDGLPMLVNQAAESLSIWLQLPLEKVPASLMMETALSRSST